jgi:molybdopterin-guanine dinucleotide biosynthesis protein A
VKGISQERVRRLFALLHPNSPALKELPRDWMRVLPTDAPLTTIERWERVFAQASAEDWPDGVDRSEIVLDHEDRTPTHGHAETREAAMAAFAKSWRRE